MTETSVRLALIVAVDVAGYSARTEADDAVSAREVLALRTRLESIAARRGGRIFSTAGDGAMIEFSAAREAVAAMLEMLDDRPADEPLVRVGAHLGDVTVAANGDLLGHGVNVAARLAAAAQPGAALVSGELKAAMGGAVSRPMRAMGDLALPKMQTKVAAFEIGAAAQSANPSAPAQMSAGSSIAVLPFVNMSADAEQEYFSDGVTEDIITDLSRWPHLSVSSRNSTFRFKGEAVDVQRVGRELGVRFVVEGSVRRIGDRVRITAQLINAETGRHVWAERYDRPISDLFAVQDEVVRQIVGTLVGRVYLSEAERLRKKPPSSLAAYDLTLRGNSLSWDDPDSAEEAKRAFARAIELDPDYGLPHSLLAALLRRDWRNDLSSSDQILDRAYALAKRGVELAENHSTAHMILGIICLARRDFTLALRHSERGLELNPANQWTQADFGSLQLYLGRPEDGLERLRSAKRADPYFNPPWFWHDLGVAQFMLRRYGEAMSDFDRVSANAGPVTLAMMAGCAAKLGNFERVRELTQSFCGEKQGVVQAILARTPFQNAADSEHFAQCMRLADIPE
jgi:TolB-like protein